MATRQSDSSFMKRLATFIVDKRNFFFLFYIFALVFSLFSTGWVKVENDITTYLGEDTETRQGLTVMNGEFASFGSARIMVSGVTYETAEALADEISGLDGVAMLSFDDSGSHFASASALFDITFSGSDNDPKSVAAMARIREILEGYDIYVDSFVGYDAIADLAFEMLEIIIVAAVIIVIVLVLTSTAYMEVPVLLMTFGAAAVLNMGTNFLCGTISFISNSVTVVLQLALAIDYAIILCHRFSFEHEKSPAREACIEALSKAIPEISSSSLTTVSGLAALGFMHFGIGLDLAIVMIKAIFLSLFSVFTLMPGLLMLFSPLIDKTKHRNLVPPITAIGKFDLKTRYIVPPLFLAVTVGAFILSGHCPYAYGYNDVTTAKQTQQQMAATKIKETFGSSNMLALIVPTGDYESERRMLAEFEAVEGVKSTMGLSGIEALDGFTLTDAVTPRQFSELVGIDYETARLLYSAYAAYDSQYGQILTGVGSYRVPLFDMFCFVKDRMDTGNIHPDDAGLEDMLSQLDSAKSQLRTENYSRMVIYMDLPEEGERTYGVVNRLHEIADQYYDTYYFVGNTTSCMDLSASFTRDNLLISVLSAVFVIIILLLTFRSVGLPILLILVIQGSIWINFSIPALTHTPLYFLGYLIVNAIQMGANIDYAIVISSHYSDLKKRMEPQKAIVQALNESFATVFTSGGIMVSAGMLIAVLTANPVIATMGNCLGRGTIISIALVLCVLPQILLMGDALVERTTFRVKASAPEVRRQEGKISLRGHVKGYVSGFVDARVEGTITGSMQAQVTFEEEGGDAQ